jgi:predicted nucleic acid-binding protein
MDRRVFLDASFWIAYRDPDGQKDFPRARTALTKMFQQQTRFVTTLPVLCEIHAYFSRHQKRKKMVIADLWNNPLVDIVPVTPQDQEQALEILAQHEDKDYPFCDVLSFVVMERMGIRRAASFDRHFYQIGKFEIVD